MKNNITVLQTESTAQNPETALPKMIQFASHLAAPTSGRQRVGKIARLPLVIRQRLNSMLDDGIPYDQILGDIPELSPAGVTTRNISTWKQGGYQDWLRQQEIKLDAQLTAEAALELAQDIESPEKISAATEIILAVQVYRALGQLHKNNEPLNEENITRLLKLGRIHASLNSQQINRERLKLQTEIAQRKLGRESCRKLAKPSDAFTAPPTTHAQSCSLFASPTKAEPPADPSVPLTPREIKLRERAAEHKIAPHELKAIYDKMEDVLGIDMLAPDPQPVQAPAPAIGEEPH